jgi:LysM domain
MARKAVYLLGMLAFGGLGLLLLFTWDWHSGARPAAANNSRTERATRTEAGPPAAAIQPTATYVVRPGDTLGRISLKYYGTSARWKLIFEANRSLLRVPRDLRSNMRLVIPLRGTMTAQVDASLPAPSALTLSATTPARPDAGSPPPGIDQILGTWSLKESVVEYDLASGAEKKTTKDLTATITDIDDKSVQVAYSDGRSFEAYYYKGFLLKGTSDGNVLGSLATTFYCIISGHPGELTGQGQELKYSVYSAVAVRRLSVASIALKQLKNPVSS